MKPSAEERRDFFRINFATPLEYKSYAPGAAPKSRIRTGDAACSRNISQSGILFQTDANPPQLSSILWMNLDMRTLRICQEIEKRCLVFENGLLGRVVRVEEDPESSAYDVGVCFLTREQKDSQEVQEVISQLKQPA